MSKSSSEKQTYSVDEMMDRLREEERNKESKEEGELVTREDGTQVVRVKKRKRRSKQEKAAKAKRAKRLGVLRALLIVALPLIFGLALLLRVVSYHSGTFGQNPNRTISERTGGNTKISRISPLVNQVSVATAIVAWPDGYLLDQLKASDLTGDLSIPSFVTGKLQGEEIEAGTGHLVFSRRESRNISSPRKGEVLALPGYKRYSSEDFSFYFGKLRSQFRLEGCEVSYEPKGYEQHLTLNGGQLTAGAWGALPVKRALVVVQGRSVAVKSFDLEGDEMAVGLSGTLELTQPKQILAVDVTEGDVANLAGEEMGAFFGGSLKEGYGTLTFDSWDLATQELSLKSPAEYLTVRNFAFMEALGEFYGESSRYRKIEFENERDFHLLRGKDWVEARDFYVAEVGVLALRGTVRIEAGILSGEVWVGLPDHKRLILRPEQLKDLMSHAELEDGFFWLKVNLSGNADVPKDDFLRYLESGSQEATGEDLFDALTR